MQINQMECLQLFNSELLAAIIEVTLPIEDTTTN